VVGSNANGINGVNGTGTTANGFNNGVTANSEVNSAV